MNTWCWMASALRCPEVGDDVDAVEIGPFLQKLIAFTDQTKTQD